MSKMSSILESSKLNPADRRQLGKCTRRKGKCKWQWWRHAISAALPRKVQLHARLLRSHGLPRIGPLRALPVSRDQASGASI